MVAQQNEAQSCDGGAADVIVYVADSHVKQAPDRFVVTRAAVSHGNGVHAAVAEDGVLEWVEVSVLGV